MIDEEHIDAVMCAAVMALAGAVSWLSMRHGIEWSDDEDDPPPADEAPQEQPATVTEIRSRKRTGTDAT